MGSFKEVQEMLLVCLEEELIDDEEFILLYESYKPQNPPFPHSSYAEFSLVHKDPTECKAYFRLEKRDVPLVVDTLRVPPELNRERVSYISVIFFFRNYVACIVHSITAFIFEGI